MQTPVTHQWYISYTWYSVALRKRLSGCERRRTIAGAQTRGCSTGLNAPRGAFAGRNRTQTKTIAASTEPSRSCMPPLPPFRMEGCNPRLSATQWGVEDRVPPTQIPYRHGGAATRPGAPLKRDLLKAHRRACRCCRAHRQRPVSRSHAAWLASVARGRPQRRAATGS